MHFGNVWRVSGLLRIDEVADETDFRAPEGDYETIGGLVMHVLGHIPAEGESVQLQAFDPDAVIGKPPRWLATVVRMDGRRIDLVDLVRMRAGEAGGAQSDG